MKRSVNRIIPALLVATVLAAVGSFLGASASAQRQSNFVGGNPSSVDASALKVIKLRFPKGSRTNWHSHPWGQLLMVEEGKGRMQERGGPVRELLPGQPVWTPANVEHWHGAAPDSEVVQLTIYSEGDVNWKGPVSDQDYQAKPGPQRR